MAKTSRPIIVEHKTDIDEYIERPMNDKEYELFLADQAIQAEYEAKRAADAEAKAALLARLGLTEDELKTILG